MIAIIDYGLGNLASVKYALDRLKVESSLTSDRLAIASADGVILPGVGAFGRAMEQLGQLDLAEATRATALSGRPFLGICLGLQLLLAHSEEHGNQQGLGVIPGRVVRFGRDLTVPHMGWNEVRQDRPSPLFEGIDDESFFYFAHSYYVEPDDPVVMVASSEYGGQFASVIQRAALFGAQFHPEKSGPVGLKMLANFCKLCDGG